LAVPDALRGAGWTTLLDAPSSPTPEGRRRPLRPVWSSSPSCRGPRRRPGTPPAPFSPPPDVLRDPGAPGRLRRPQHRL